MAVYLKDPSAILDYGFDWSDWLASGETISISTWTVDDGITKDSDSKSSTATTIWLSGGTANTEYNIVNHITTSAGREDERTHIIRVRQR